MGAIRTEEQTEQLSHLIDAMNKGKAQELPQSELGELMQIANLVKKAAGQEMPPGHIISQTVRSLAEKPARTASRRWQHAALAGAVAAAFLVFAQLHPQEPVNQNDKQLAQVVEQPLKLENRQAITPPMTISPLPPEVKAPTVPPAVVAVPEPPRAPERQSGESVKPISPLATRQAASREPEAPLTAAVGSTSASDKIEQPSNDSGKQGSAMKLPGRQADTIMRQGGRIRQVYSAGQADELIITQQETAASTATVSKMTPLTDALASTPSMEKEKTGLNEVTVVVKGRQITVQGRKTAEELQTIANQLIEEE